MLLFLRTIRRALSISIFLLFYMQYFNLADLVWTIYYCLNTNTLRAR